MLPFFSSELFLDNESINEPHNTQYSEVYSVSNTISGNTPTLTGIHLNCRSLWKNYESISHLLSQCKFDVVALTETWLQSNTPLQMLSIPNYNLINTDRPDKRGGGVGFYVADHVKYVVRQDLMKTSVHFESMFIEITSSKKNIIIGVIYRPLHPQHHYALRTCHHSQIF